jgi:hypothetical protein
MLNLYSNKNIFLLIFFLPLNTTTIIKAKALANKLDPLCQSSVAGIDPFPAKKESSKGLAANFYITPYYQDGTKSRSDRRDKKTSVDDGNGEKFDVGIMEERGIWKTAGIYYGIADIEMKEDGAGIQTTQSNENYESRAIHFAPKDFVITRRSTLSMTTTTGATTPTTGQGNIPGSIAEIVSQADWKNDNYKNFYSGLLNLLYDTGTENKMAELAAPNLSAQSTNQATINHPDTSSATSYPASDLRLENHLLPDNINFNTDNTDLVGLRRFAPKVHRYGARGEVFFSPFEGIKVLARGGACEIKVTPEPLIALGPSPITSDADKFNKALSCDVALEKIGKEIGLSFGPYHNWTFEDTFLAVSAGQSFEYHDKEDDISVFMAPSIEVGVWVPTSKKYDVAEGNKFAFYIPVGNEGHTGMSITGNLTFEFPGTTIFSCGAGATVFNDLSIKDFRLPNHPQQRGIYPFKIDIKRKLGETYFAYASLKSIDFSSGASFYCDYTYVSHRKDKILLDDSDSERNKAFETGRAQFVKDSIWNTQELAVGINYKIADGIELGGAFKVNTNASAAPLMRSWLGNVKFSF